MQTQTSHNICDLVESALHRRLLGTRDLRFELRDGTVVLSGLVRSYYQKQMAQESVRSIEGIDAVDNQIEVINW